MYVYDVVKSFEDNRKNLQGKCEWGPRDEKSQIRAKGDILVSKDEFPLAIRIPEGRLKGKILRNGEFTHGDKTIRSHQIEVLFGMNMHHPTTAFNGLALAGVCDKTGFPNFKNWEIVDVQEDSRTRMYYIKGEKPRKYYESMFPLRGGSELSPPSQGVFLPIEERINCDGETEVTGSWHVLGGILFRNKKTKKCLVCGLDDNSYFVTEIPKPANTVSAALLSLRPKEVAKAQRVGKKVVRQGEWFFVDLRLGHWDDLLEDLGLSDKEAKANLKINTELPLKPKQENPHRVEKLLKYKGDLYVRGRVSHREHGRQPLRGWWKAYRNLEKNSWSVAGGRAGFD